jgi:hypothetical protein
VSSVGSLWCGMTTGQLWRRLFALLHGQATDILQISVEVTNEDNVEVLEGCCRVHKLATAHCLQLKGRIHVTVDGYCVICSVWYECLPFTVWNT